MDFNFRILGCTLVTVVFHLQFPLSVNGVIVFTEPKFGGNNKTWYPLTSCVSSFPNEVKGKISSVNSQGKCVNMYKGENCAGDYIVVAPGTPIHYDLSHWPGFNKNVTSLGPCYEKCDPKSVQQPPGNNSTFSVTLYSDVEYQGSHISLNLTSGCHLIPPKLKGEVSSVKPHSKFCVELHHDFNCRNGRSIHLRPGSPKHEDLRYWVGHDDRAMAISLCGFGCNKDDNVAKIEPFPELPSHSIRLFDQQNLEGNFKELSLSSPSCVNLLHEWDSEIASLEQNGNCLVLFDEFNCRTTNIGNNLTLSLSKEDEKIARNLTIKSFSRITQSIKLCDGKVENLQQSNWKPSEWSLLEYIVIGLSVVIVFVGVITGLRRNLGEIRRRLRYLREDTHSLIL